MAKEKEEIVKLEQKVEVTGTGKYSMQKGVKYNVHPLMAAKLIKKGAATKDLK